MAPRIDSRPRPLRPATTAAQTAARAPARTEPTPTPPPPSLASFEAARRTTPKTALEYTPAAAESPPPQAADLFGAPPPPQLSRDDAFALVASFPNAYGATFLRDALLPGANLVLKSCSTGSGRNREENVANLLAHTFPQANVYASTVPSNNIIRLGEDGRFLAPGFFHGKVYSVPARAAE